MITIEQLQSIQKEFCGLIPSQIVAERCIKDKELSFEQKHIEALSQLEDLVINGLLNYLNDNNSNSYFRLPLDKYNLDGDQINNY